MSRPQRDQGLIVENMSMRKRPPVARVRAPLDVPPNERRLIPAKTRNLVGRAPKRRWGRLHSLEERLRSRLCPLRSRHGRRRCVT